VNVGTRSSARRAFRSVLIANRGEIAVRIIRACRDLGITSVLAHSDIDRDSLAARMADETICIGSAHPRASYLNSDAIIAAALASQVDAVHPGYGFLSENAEFLARCEAEGVTAVAPGSAAVALMGNKMKAREFAASAGVPLVPGTQSAVTPDEAVREADEIGYPVILKAAAGGGGRGMRLAPDRESLRRLTSAAAAEAGSAFGDASVYVEKYLADARHVEVQVAFDAMGNGASYGERDCTIQRRYQKLVEEAPSDALDDRLRDGLADAALALCESARYLGVGTVEFLFDQQSRKFYFIEMNTRLQVEHPVTEAVTGHDLVALQFLIAQGESLPAFGRQPAADGHAIEYRINAEDAHAGFTPSTGTLDRWSPPLGPGVRVDTHCYAGYRVPPYYDSLLAKLIVWGENREQALARSRRALAEFEVEGVKTTIPFHRWLVDQQEFADMATNTGWVERTWPTR
jgi:acetyl-CoA carboxylase biotin carboxylase subunit